MDFSSIFSAIFQPIILVLLSIVAIMLLVALGFVIITFIIVGIHELKEEYHNKDNDHIE